MRILDKLENPLLWRRVGAVAGWAALGVLVAVPEAYAAFPIPGLSRMVTDVQDGITQEGGLIGSTLGIGGAALRVILSNFEMGVGHFIRAGGGGALIGSTPELASYTIS